MKNKYTLGFVCW